MRRTLSMLMEIRQLQLRKQNAEDTRISEVADRYRVFDNLLSNIKPTDTNTQIEETMISADFAYALQEFVQRQMVPGYTEKTFDFEPLVKPDTLPNYLEVTRYQNREGIDDLEWVGEKGEARPGHVSDAIKREYKVEVWEKQYDFSMRALVNDDLGYFNDMAMMMGRSARRTLEKYVARMFTNATSIARLVGLGALYSTTGRLTTARISEARMAFNQRTNAAGEPILAALKFLLFPSILVDTVATIQNSTLVPELATNAANVVKGTFTPIECPFITFTAPNVPWWAFADWRTNGIVPFVLARRQGVPAPRLFRKKSDIESITSLLGGGSDVNPIMGDFSTGNVVVKVSDEWGTYIDGTEGNYFDFRGGYYSDGTAA